MYLATYFITGEVNRSPTEVNGKIPINFNRARILLKVFKWGLSWTSVMQIFLCARANHICCLHIKHIEQLISSVQYFCLKLAILSDNNGEFYMAWKKKTKKTNLYKGFDFFSLQLANIYICRYLIYMLLFPWVPETINRNMPHGNIVGYFFLTHVHTYKGLKYNFWKDSRLKRRK